MAIVGLRPVAGGGAPGEGGGGEGSGGTGEDCGGIKGTGGDPGGSGGSGGGPVINTTLRGVVHTAMRAVEELLKSPLL
jgi:hypothetical protein